MSTVTQDARALFERAGAFLRGHFIYASGRHGADYLEKFRILEDPDATAQLCLMIAAHFRDQGVQLVAGPTLGGALVAYEVARQLRAKAVYAEPEERGRAFRRGFVIPPGARVLVVDDVVTTGGSVAQVLSAVRDAQGVVIGVGVLAERASIDLQVPTFACLRVELPSYPAEACPLCAQGREMGVKRGSG